MFDRVRYLEGLVEGKRVLDIGAVAHFAEQSASAEWLHARIAKKAAYCLGVDVLSDAVNHLKAQGYNIECVDVLREDIGDAFDVVMCGEVIEHLDEPGALFDAARRLLLPGGRFVITSPNPFEIWEVVRQAIGRGNTSVDHVLFAFPSSVAELAQRHGLSLQAFRGTMISGKHSLKHRLMYGLCRYLTHAEFYCSTFIYECVRQ